MADTQARSSNLESVPVRMLHDRLLVEPDKETGERKSSAGIVIPATARVGRRLAWGTVVATGPLVRQVSLGDSVLFDPEEQAEVELDARTFTLLRERDVHGIADQPDDSSTGLYL